MRIASSRPAVLGHVIDGQGSWAVAATACESVTWRSPVAPPQRSMKASTCAGKGATSIGFSMIAVEARRVKRSVSSRHHRRGDRDHGNPSRPFASARRTWSAVIAVHAGQSDVHQDEIGHCLADELDAIFGRASPRASGSRDCRMSRTSFMFLSLSSTIRMSCAAARSRGRVRCLASSRREPVDEL